MDARTEEEKQKISWTHALRKIVINCYKYHGREDLLPAFSEEDEKANAIATANANVSLEICYLLWEFFSNFYHKKCAAKKWNMMINKIGWSS
jgi:hypothetical protein